MNFGSIIDLPKNCLGNCNSRSIKPRFWLERPVLPLRLSNIVFFNTEHVFCLYLLRPCLVANFFGLGTVVLSFLFSNYYPIMD